MPREFVAVQNFKARTGFGANPKKQMPEQATALYIRGYCACESLTDTAFGRLENFRRLKIIFAARNNLCTTEVVTASCLIMDERCGNVQGKRAYRTFASACSRSAASREP
jgi:hypothetical protein